VSAILLTQVNVWLDVIFTTVFVLLVLGLLGHMVGNTISGRFKKRFGQWAWPQNPHPSGTQKFLHIQHVACMFLLAFSGMYIRFPFFDGGRTAMRWVHYVAMIVVVANLIWRLWYAFASPRRDWREFAVTKRDITTMPKVLMYYLFIKPSKPHLAKYNIMQKLTYSSFVPLLIIQAITGFSLIQNKIIMGMSPRYIILGWWLGPLVGGTALVGAWARIIHYTFNWLFIILTTVHVYLSVSEDFPEFLDFFGMKELAMANAAKHGQLAHGAEGHGDGHGHEAEPAPGIEPPQAEPPQVEPAPVPIAHEAPAPVMAEAD
jgi:Ni/Fe-hydrogenase 1 B-type cytochrome subunit